MEWVKTIGGGKLPLKMKECRKERKALRNIRTRVHDNRKKINAVKILNIKSKNVTPPTCWMGQLTGGNKYT